MLHTDAFEIVCCNCGDDPYLDYSQVLPRLQKIRGPYTIAAGLAAYEKHLEFPKHPTVPPERHPIAAVARCGSLRRPRLVSPMPEGAPSGQTQHKASHFVAEHSPNY